MAAKRRSPVATAPLDADAVLAELARLGKRADPKSLLRFGIVTAPAYGLAMADVHKLAKRVGTRPDLVEALWRSEVYEARLLCAFVHDPAKVTPTQMDRWCRTFDNWGIVDTLCFKLWDRTPHALTKVDAWCTRAPEFEKRAAFALLACLALHGKDLDDAEFERRLPLCEAAATDARNFVKKGVLWALNAMGRRGAVLRRATLALCERMAGGDDKTARWVGKTALREIGKAMARG